MDPSFDLDGVCYQPKYSFMSEIKSLEMLVEFLVDLQRPTWLTEVNWASRVQQSYMPSDMMDDISCLKQPSVIGNILEFPEPCSIK